MRRKRNRLPAKLSKALVLIFVLPATGCLSPLAKQTTVLATATAPVVDQAAAVYSSANAIHFMRTDYDAIAEFDQASPVYNPRTITPLLSDLDINVRLAVLAAFQAYVQSLAAVTDGADTPQVQAAAKSAGENLASFGNALAPSIESALGIAVATQFTTQTTVTTTSGGTTSTSVTSPSTPVNPITPAVQSGIGIAVHGLAEFLINKKLKKELPQTIESMDPQIKLLCELLESDIDILRGIEDRDYNSVINRQTLFIREPSSKLDPEERREEIMKLPAIARQQLASDRQLSTLSASIASFKLAHHSLAAEVRESGPKSLKQKLTDLEAAGENLGRSYLSQ